MLPAKNKAAILAAFHIQEGELLNLGRCWRASSS